MENRSIHAIIDSNFKNAVEDYSYLIEKEYSAKASLKLIGDRYRLNRQQRDIISRSISSEIDSIHRKSKKISFLDSKIELFIDFYNVFFTILNYLNGKLVFLCTDSFLRDNGGIYGKFDLNSNQNQKVIDMIISYLNDLELLRVEFLLDSPISYSGEMASYINEKTKESVFNSFAYTTRSPDYELKRIEKGVISTSDSIIIDNSKTNIYDLSFNIIKLNFAPTILDINQLINKVSNRD